VVLVYIVGCSQSDRAFWLTPQDIRNVKSSLDPTRTIPEVDATKMVAKTLQDTHGAPVVQLIQMPPSPVIIVYQEPWQVQLLKVCHAVVLGVCLDCTFLIAFCRTVLITLVSIAAAWYRLPRS